MNEYTATITSTIADYDHGELTIYAEDNAEAKAEAKAWAKKWNGGDFNRADYTLRLRNETTGRNLAPVHHRI